MHEINESYLEFLIDGNDLENSIYEIGLLKILQDFDFNIEKIASVTSRTMPLPELHFKFMGELARVYLKHEKALF